MRNVTKHAWEIRASSIGLSRFAVLVALIFGGCGLSFPPEDQALPFADLQQVPVDGTVVSVRGNAARLGVLNAGAGLRIRVDTSAADSFLLLRQESPETALYVGGGTVSEQADFAIAVSGDYIVFLPTLNTEARVADMRISAERLSAAPSRPAEQFVRVLFEPSVLTAPGLLDPVDGTDADRDVLLALEATVRDEVLLMLQDIFAGTPVRILGPDETAPAGPFSTLTYSPQRVLAEDQDLIDAAQPAPDPTLLQCQVRVLFGEVLPRGTEGDSGNRRPDDQAMVYVGSFQGRGRECWTSIINSVNNIVFALAQTGAHEIGHLVGLMHVEQIDLMNRTATLAFLRELDFLRGQIQVERTTDGATATEVFTSVIQDPTAYFESVFDQSESAVSPSRGPRATR